MAGPLVLWDIDGTLLRARGLGVRAFATSIERVTGRALGGGPYDLGGHTDPAIAVALLRAAGASCDPETVAQVLAGVVAAYYELSAELAASVQVMPGVAAALAALRAIDAHQSIVTGNVRAVAEQKLAAAGLAGLLSVDTGAFGSDHEDRAVLAALALARCADALGRGIDPSSAWVVGDTPRDLACARAVGAKCALVGTGTFGLRDLEPLGADVTLSDLSDTAAFIDAIVAP